MKKVLIPTKLDPVAREMLEAHGAYTVVQDDSAGLEDLLKDHRDAFALIVRSEKVTAEILDAMPSLKVVVRAGAGYNTIDIKHARSRGVDVMNTPGANANAVAEEVVALMLADARHVVKADSSVRSGKWEKKKFMGREITGKRIGIVGLGAIGRSLVQRLAGFEMSICAYDPFVSAEKAEALKVELSTLEDLFSSCDYISLHLPENDETRGLISTSLLDLMKPGTTLVNCARAGIIDEAALAKAREEKSIRFLNDVYPKDAEGEKSIASHADVMLPHLGASTKEANFNAAKRAAEQIVEWDEKGITRYVVNREGPEGLDTQYLELSYVLAKLCRSMVGAATQLKLIETSFYGTLQPFSDWLLVPVVAALNTEFDRSSDRGAAAEFLKDMGVDYLNREVDAGKGYENSITVDLTGNLDLSNLRHSSVRGTYAEGNLMISRINDFDKLYFQPHGHTVVFIYPDRPGVLGHIGAAMAEAEINIDDVRNPHDSKGLKSLAILKVSRSVPDEVIQKVAADIDAETAFHIAL